MTTKKTKVAKPTDAEQVNEYMDKLEHPLKAEIEALRSIIKSSNSKISERIKWNAPSYYTNADLVTFNCREQKRVHLVFHHPAVVQIKSPLLEGDYKDRRMSYFKDMAAIKSNQKELESVISELVRLAEQA